jgi:hypothetical protein
MRYVSDDSFMDDVVQKFGRLSQIYTKTFFIVLPKPCVIILHHRHSPRPSPVMDSFLIPFLTGASHISYCSMAGLSIYRVHSEGASC